MISKVDVRILMYVSCTAANTLSLHFPSSGKLLQLMQTNTHCLLFKNVRLYKSHIFDSTFISYMYYK